MYCSVAHGCAETFVLHCVQKPMYSLIQGSAVNYYTAAAGRAQIPITPQPDSLLHSTLLLNSLKPFQTEMNQALLNFSAEHIEGVRVR